MTKWEVYSTSVVRLASPIVELVGTQIHGNLEDDMVMAESLDIHRTTYWLEASRSSSRAQRPHLVANKNWNEEYGCDNIDGEEIWCK